MSANTLCTFDAVNECSFCINSSKFNNSYWLFNRLYLVG